MCRIRVAFIVSVFLAAGLFACFSCKETPPEPPPPPPPGHVPVIHLSVADTGLTDLWLRVRFDDTLQQRSWRLTRDGQPLLTLAQAPLDTVILDDSLAVKRTYTYKAYRLNGTVLTDSTALLQATTLDTTSHNFFWQIDTLGDGNSSVLYDVAIVNDTLTIACGEIYLRDSTGQYQPPFGLAIWNGRQWQLTRVYATGPTGVVSNLVPRGIWALSTTEIWLASGGVFRWNGRDVNATPYWINSFPGNPNPIWTAGQYAQRVWGSSSQRMYAIGTVGAIAVFDGSTWQRIESGTTADINDIWGSTDPGSGLRLTLAAASNVATPGEMKILRITGQNTVDTIGWVTGRRVNSIWFRNERKLFTAGGGVFIRGLDMGWQEQIQIPLVYTRRVRGNGINDVFVVGDFGVVTHFNGVSWRVYPEVAAALYYSCDYNGRSMIAVGERSARAVVLRGHRN